jgi:hypothetical protein
LPDDFIPLEINTFFGLISKQSKAKLPLGASSSSDTFHDIDLSKPGQANTRGGSVSQKNVGYIPKRLWDWYVPANDTHYPISQGGTKVTVLDQSFNILNEDTGFTDGSIFDFLNYGDELFYSNETDGNRIASIVSSSPAFRKWGITKPSSANTFAADSGTGLTGTFLYKYTYVNSTSGHESSASPASASHTVANKTINLTGLAASADTQVDKINIYRTTNGGATYFYLTQISNGTTTYADSTADTALGTDEAPLYNDPPPVSFTAIEEWDGRIWGFKAGDTKLYFSNNEFYSLVGNPEESFHPDNFIDLRAKIWGIRKSPNFNEMWAHTSKGIYGTVNTYIDADPYRAPLRNSNVYSGSPYAIVNVYNSQWFTTEDFRVLSIDSAGNTSYESENIEPDMNAANQTKSHLVQVVHYHGNNKNQVRFIYPLSGQTNPNRMLAANYLQRAPTSRPGVSNPVWEYHRISSTAIGVIKDSNGFDVLYTGHTDSTIKKQDTGTDDDGAAIDWSFELGWFRGSKDPTRSLMPRRAVQYFNPLGNWSFSLQTNFDFGVSGGDVYSITVAPQGARWDIDFIWDISAWGYSTPLQRVPTDLRGVFSHAQFIWYGNTLDQTFEMHSFTLLMHKIEGFRGVNQ